MRPVDRAGPVTGLNHAWFPRWEKVKDPGDKFWCQIRETKQTWRNTKILTFGHIIAWVTFKAVSLQLNRMLMMRKIVQEMQDNAIQTARIHPAVHLGNRDEVLIWQNFQPAYRELWNRASPPLIWTHRKFYKVFRGMARTRKPGQPGQPGSYEEAFILLKDTCLCFRHYHGYLFSITKYFEGRPGK